MEFPRLTEEQFNNVINELLSVAKNLAFTNKASALHMKSLIRKIEIDRMCRDNEDETIKELSFCMD